MNIKRRHFLNFNWQVHLPLFVFDPADPASACTSEWHPLWQPSDNKVKVIGMITSISNILQTFKYSIITYWYRSTITTVIKKKTKLGLNNSPWECYPLRVYIHMYNFTLDFIWSSIGCSWSSIALIFITMGAWECLSAERFLLASSRSLFTLLSSLRLVSYSWWKRNRRFLLHFDCKELEYSCAAFQMTHSPPMVSSFPGVWSCPDASSFHSNGSHRVCSSHSSVLLSQGS